MGLPPLVEMMVLRFALENLFLLDFYNCIIACLWCEISLEKTDQKPRISSWYI